MDTKKLKLRKPGKKMFANFAMQYAAGKYLITERICDFAMSEYYYDLDDEKNRKSEKELEGLAQKLLQNPARIAGPGECMRIKANTIRFGEKDACVLYNSNDTVSLVDSRYIRHFLSFHPGCYFAAKWKHDAVYVYQDNAAGESLIIGVIAPLRQKKSEDYYLCLAGIDDYSY